MKKICCSYWCCHWHPSKTRKFPPCRYVGAAQGSAAAAAAAVAARVSELVTQLPSDFFEPLVVRGALDEAQVGFCAITWIS